MKVHICLLLLLLCKLLIALQEATQHSAISYITVHQPEMTNMSSSNDMEHVPPRLDIPVGRLPPGGYSVVSSGKA